MHTDRLTCEREYERDMSGISPTDGSPLVQAGSGGSTAGRYPSRRRLDNVHCMEYDIYVHVGMCMDTAGHGKGEHHHACQ